MAKQLRTAGYTVTVANHGQEALDHLLTTQFCKSNGGSELDIVLMDIEMPVMDGLKCSKRVRDMEISGEVKGKLPMIAVTANARAEQQAQAMKAGFDAVITKPFRMGELVLEMERICGG
jgi:CheY-like chemotaxis protein